MSTALLILGILTSLAFVTYIERKRQLYRKAWHETANLLFREQAEHKTARLQREIANKLAHTLRDKVDAQAHKLAECMKLSTDLSVAVDALMNGDKRCANGHRYYAPADKCPHCGVKDTGGIEVRDKDGKLIDRMQRP